MKKYQENIDSYSKEYQAINQKFKTISALRIITILSVLLLIYFFLSQQNGLFIVLAGVCFILFLVLVKIHVQIVFKRKLTQAYIDINADEIKIQSGEISTYNDGSSHKTPHHQYANDLDLFGRKSIYHLINRTFTFIGQESLGKRFLNVLNPNEIPKHQAAVKELSEKLEWRQKYAAHAKITEDSEITHKQLTAWSKSELMPLSRIKLILSYITPFIVIGAIVAWYFTDQTLYSNIAFYTFLINLFILFSEYGKFKKEMDFSTKIDDILKNYSFLIGSIESEKFDSELLKNLQEKLQVENKKASDLIRSLSQSFSQLDNIQNPVGATVINGFTLYHFRVYNRLIENKKAVADRLPLWLEIIGEFEALNSLANYKYNHPEYCFPSINNEQKISFRQLGHPLLDAKIRVNNDVDFIDKKFVILTGSNMSGKSTFLRSIGVNMVLAQIGAPVCATEASLHPLPLWVSMRLEDSLNDNESYFFAEVKRLQTIMNAAEKDTIFVLLDEILRGTNSDDKRTGTIEVIKKLIGKKTMGIVATHDLEVCNTTNQYPDYLANMSFEAEITNDELNFDYTLRPGICMNKNATFLMKKMGVI